MLHGRQVLNVKSKVTPRSVVTSVENKVLYICSEESVVHIFVKKKVLNIC